MHKWLISQHHLNNSRSQRILWILEELNIPYKIDVYKRGSDQLAPKELKQVHPLGKSPVITDTDRGYKVVAESGHIINYLIKYYGNGRGLPSKEREEDNDFWTQFCEASLMPKLVMKFVFMVVPSQAPFFVRPIVSIICNQVQSRLVNPDIKSMIPFVADALQKEKSDGRAWFAGGDKDGNPTAADYQMLFALEAITTIGMDGQQVPEVLRNWVDMVHQRPAYIRAYQKGGEYDYAKL